METVTARLHTTEASGSQESAPGTQATTGPRASSAAATMTASTSASVSASAGASCTGTASRTTARHRPTAECSPAPDRDHPHGAEPLDLVTVPARQGLEAVDILRRAAATSVWPGPSGPDGAQPAAVGPVLHDEPCDTVGFLVPPGTADGWDLPGSACTQTLGRGVSFALPAEEPGAGLPLAPGSAPAPGEAWGPASAAADRAPEAPFAGWPGGCDGSAPSALPCRETAAAYVPEPPVSGTGWLLPPAGQDHVTDPAVLRRALGEAARLIEAADRCR